MCSMVKIFQYCFIQASSGTLKLVTVIVDIVYKFDSHLSTALDSLASSTAFILLKHDIERFALSLSQMPFLELLVYLHWGATPWDHSECYSGLKMPSFKFCQFNINESGFKGLGHNQQCCKDI